MSMTARRYQSGRHTSARFVRPAVEPLEARNLLSLALDPSFTYPTGNPAGHVFVRHNGEAAVMDIQSDGKIVLGGFTFKGLNNNPDFALARINPDGSPDATFNGDGNSDGVIFASFFDNPVLETIQAVAFQNILGEERIVVAGRASLSPGAGHVFALMRFHPDGSPDLSFGCLPGNNCGGKVVIRFIDQGQIMMDGFAWALAIQNDNKIVVSGYADFAPGQTGKKFAVARLTAAGRVDVSFGVRGRVAYGVTDQNEARALQLLPPHPVTGQQKILVAGSDNYVPNRNMYVAQLEANGALDTDEFAAEASNPHKGIRLIDFSTGGILHEDFPWHFALQSVEGSPEKRILIAGETRFDPGTGDQFRDFALARLLPNGDLDPTFGDHQPPDGKRTLHVGYEDVAVGMAVHTPPGRTGDWILIAGYSFFQTEPATPSFFSGARFSPDATEPDAVVETFRSTFPDTTGHADRAWDVKVWGDRIYVGGFHTDTVGPGFGVIRLCEVSCALASPRNIQSAPAATAISTAPATGKDTTVADGRPLADPHERLTRPTDATSAIGLFADSLAPTDLPFRAYRRLLLRDPFHADGLVPAPWEVLQPGYD
jgi:uncharacterized delta-60 repeat protein